MAGPMHLPEDKELAREQKKPSKDNPKKTRGINTSSARPQKDPPKGSKPKDKAFFPVKTVKGY